MDSLLLKSRERLSFEVITRLTRVFVQLGVKKVRLTGGEPLLRSNVSELGELIALNGVQDVALTTNGVTLGSAFLECYSHFRLIKKSSSMAGDRVQELACQQSQHQKETDLMTGARTTKAFVLEKIGYDGLMERTRQVPPTGRGQVLVRMKAASLNFRDLKILKGAYFRNPVLPKVLLSDGAGEVVEVGADVTAYKPGDRVLLIYMEGWYTGPMDPERKGWKSKSSEVDGVALEYAVYDEADLLPIPDSMSYAEAACIPCAGVTAWHALISVGRLKTGDTVLVLGSGGVSIFGLQIARMSGARVIATSSDNAKLKRLLKLGASDGINYKEEPNWGEAVVRLTGGRGVDQVLEIGGDGTIRQSIRATRDGGRIASVGNLSGDFIRVKHAERGIEVASIAVGSREMNEELMRAIEMHRQMPVIDSTFSFTDLKEALSWLEAGKHFGKVIITF